MQKVAQWAKVNGRKFALVEYQDLTPASARMVPRALQRCSVAVQTHKMPVCDSFEQKVALSYSHIWQTMNIGADYTVILPSCPPPSSDDEGR